MRETQNLSLNPTKISGTCGRLMCCLKYEQEAYEDAVKRCPKQESFVETPDGVGTVSAVNLLRETVKVRLDDTPEAPKTFHTSEICVVRNGKGKRPENYVAPPKSELEKLRKVTPKEEEPGEALSRRLDALLGSADQQESKPASRRRSAPRPEGKQENRAASAPKGGQEGRQKPQAPKSQPQKASKGQQPPRAEGQGGENKNRNRPRRRHRGPRPPKKEGGAPKSE